jgi:hypothetical protein
MKKVFNIIYSSKTTMFLLLFFAIAIGLATFIEEWYDTNTAKSIVYEAKWFELLLALLALNFIGNIK